MLPSWSTAVTVQRSPLRTHPWPAIRVRSFCRVTIRSLRRQARLRRYTPRVSFPVPGTAPSGMFGSSQPDGILRRGSATATLAVPPEHYVRAFGHRFELAWPDWPRPDPSIGAHPPAAVIRSR